MFLHVKKPDLIKIKEIIVSIPENIENLTIALAIA